MDPQEDEVPQTSIKVVASRSKAKTKPQQTGPVDTTANIPMHERRWIGIEPSEQNLASYDLSKKIINLLPIKRYSGKKMEQLNSTANTTLVWWSLESLFGCRRRIEKKISVLLWWFWKNSLPPCSSRTLWKQSHWSYVTGQCGDWDWNIPSHLPRRLRVQSSSYYQQWIGTWRSRFAQKTNSVLLACWSKKWKSQRPRT